MTTENMPEIIYAKRYGEAGGGTYWEDPQNKDRYVKYIRADLNDEEMKKAYKDLLKIVNEKYDLQDALEQARSALSSGKHNHIIGAIAAIDKVLEKTK